MKSREKQHLAAPKFSWFSTAHARKAKIQSNVQIAGRLFFTLLIPFSMVVFGCYYSTDKTILQYSCDLAISALIIRKSPQVTDKSTRLTQWGELLIYVDHGGTDVSQGGILTSGSPRLGCADE